MRIKKWWMETTRCALILKMSYLLWKHAHKLWWNQFLDPTNGPISLHSIWNSFVILKLSKVLSKCFIIINSQSCVPKQHGSENKITWLRYVCELWSSYCIRILLYTVPSTATNMFSSWNLAQVNQKVTILFSSTRNILCDIPILRISWICNFGGKHLMSVRWTLSI